MDGGAAAAAVSFPKGQLHGGVGLGCHWEPTDSETLSLPGKRRAVCAESVSQPSPHTLGPLPKPNVTAMILEGGRPGREAGLPAIK